MHLILLSIHETDVYALLRFVCCNNNEQSLFFLPSSQGEPGYAIAGTDANFVPGRKGEPGSSVSFREGKKNKIKNFPKKQTNKQVVFER